MEAVKEAQALCPGQRIDCLISLGAGKGLHNGSGSIAHACSKMGESSKRVARKVKARAAQEGWSASYFRASVKGLKNKDNQGEWENPDWVKAGTIKYLFIDARSQFVRHLDNLINGNPSRPQSSSLGGIPPEKLGWDEYPLVGRGFSRCPSKLVYIPSRWEKPLPMRGYSSQLVGRNPSWRAGGGYPRVSARIHARASGYPPADADVGADVRFC
ncbi:hypothetical protein PGTUg99_023704 [Puccinia graminis f. sp. tritici]|uniref:Uncharacterized protein n=1 Tax=Puccinia graminis f. sp. tritici TaxID=56615 RepID=A0A5B0SJ95_PUCGR|nr:hypothetical protein PGTUg99_023704 [Puccinia graminis f. sp. tritici]